MKTLLVEEALYPEHKLLFMFENTISHAIYAKYILQVIHINKKSQRQQHFLRPGWYKTTDREIII